MDFDYKKLPDKGLRDVNELLSQYSLESSIFNFSRVSQCQYNKEKAGKILRLFGWLLELVKFPPWYVDYLSQQSIIISIP